MKRALRKFWWFFLVIPFLLVGGFVIWGETPLGPMDEALVALQSDAKVTVETGDWFVFRPLDVQPAAGFIFYPGGRVDARSYAPMARAIAEQGYLVVITPMPLSLAVLSPGRASQVIAAFPEVHHWAIGGHSRGGVMAANFAHQNPTLIQGLALWASYPTSSDNLSAQSIKVVSIYATLDGLSTGDKIDASRPLLPANTQWVAIQGGDHAQFGWYGDQPGDNPATISRKEQQDQIVAATVALLEAISE
jgi:acetyl esterase/lipase